MIQSFQESDNEFNRVDIGFKKCTILYTKVTVSLAKVKHDSDDFSAIIEIDKKWMMLIHPITERNVLKIVIKCEGFF